MLRIALIFFVLAVLAAFFGAYRAEQLAYNIGIVLAAIAVVLLIVGMIAGRNGTPPAL